MSNEIDDKLLERMKKMLRLSQNNPNEHEAATAAAMLQELLAAHNLSMAVLEQGTKQGKARTDKRTQGGLYKWQRDLWEAIATLNFCRYWTEEHYDNTKPSTYAVRRWGAEYAKERLEMGWDNGKKSFVHRVLGRDINVMSVNMMAEYLQDTIERLARDYSGNDPKRYYIPDVIAYREGLASRLVQRLEKKRRDMEAEEKSRYSGSSTGTAITLASVRDSEEAANYDYLHGEGAWQRRKDAEAKARAEWYERMERQKRAAEEADRIQREWELNNPEAAREKKVREAEEAAALMEAAAKEARKRAQREAYNASRRKGSVSYYRKATRHDGPGYYQGLRDGDRVSLDAQVDSSKPVGVIG